MEENAMSYGLWAKGYALLAIGLLLVLASFPCALPFYALPIAHSP